MKSSLKTGLLLAASLVLLSSCSDDGDGPSDPVDPQRPTVNSVSPEAGSTNAFADQEIMITFDRDMDPGTSDGNVTSSLSDIQSSFWTGARTLHVLHTTWAEDTDVTVTVGAGLTDTDGMSLAAPYAWSFRTQRVTPIFLESSPAAGAVGVARNTGVRMRFAPDMDMSTLTAATTVSTSPPTAKADLPFQLAAAGDGWVEMTFADNLPATSVIDVAVSTGAMSSFGYPLAEGVAFSFTTSELLDTTPPTLLSVVPANGSVVPLDTPGIVFTFDEAIDPSTFAPDMLSAHFAILFEMSGADVSWSGDGTQMTVPVPAGVPAGLGLAARFDGFSDTAGNQQTTTVDYRIDFAGESDPWPFTDGSRYVYGTDDTQTPPGGSPATNSYIEYIQVNVQGNGDYRWASYNSDAYLSSPGYDIYRRTATAVTENGWSWSEDGESDSGTLSPGVVWAKLPFAVQSWSGTSTITESGGSLSAGYDVAVVGREDVVADLDDDGTDYVWLDCWKTTRSYTLSAGGTVVGSGTGSFWFAPAVGIVKSEMTEIEDDGWTVRTVQNLSSFSN